MSKLIQTQKRERKFHHERGKNINQIGHNIYLTSCFNNTPLLYGRMVVSTPFSTNNKLKNGCSDNFDSYDFC